MRVVFITFYCDYFNFKLLAFYFDQFFKSFFDIWYQKNFSSVSWTKYEMIVYQRYGCVCVSVFIFHIHIILQYVYKINIYIHIYFKYFALSIPHLKEWAFRAFIVNISITSQEIPFSSKSKAASIASFTNCPQAMIHTSFPSLTTFPLPRVNSEPA